MAIGRVAGQNIGTQGEGVSSLSRTFPSNITGGNCICVAITSYGAYSGASSVADTRSNIYANPILNYGGGTPKVSIYYALNITGGSCTVTYTPTSSSDCALSIMEYSGVAASAALDVTATGTGTSAAPATGNLVCTDNDLIFAVMDEYDNRTITTGTNYTTVYNQNVVFECMGSEDRILTATGTYTAIWSLSASTTWSCAAIALKPAAAGGADVRNHIIPAYIMMQ